MKADGCASLGRLGHCAVLPVVSTSGRSDATAARCCFVAFAGTWSGPRNAGRGLGGGAGGSSRSTFGQRASSLAKLGQLGSAYGSVSAARVAAADATTAIITTRQSFQRVT